MKQYKTYIFDLDGTLLNTLNDLAASTNYALRQFAMPEHDIDSIRRFVGNGVRLLMERAIPDGARNPQFEECFATFRYCRLLEDIKMTSAKLKHRAKLQE